MVTDFSLTPGRPKWFQSQKALSHPIECLPCRLHFEPDRQFREIMGQTPDLRYCKMRESGKGPQFSGEMREFQQP